MPKMPAFDPVEYLVGRKFHLANFYSLRSKEVAEESKKQADAYRSQLKLLSDAELQQAVIEERSAEAKEREAELFYNKPNAMADFSYWSKATYWTLDEAVALSFGRDPKVVNWDRIKSHVQVSSFPAEYEKRRELVVRAKHWKQLQEPVLPSFFLAWLKRYELSCPQALEEAIVARGHHIADWKTLFDQEREARLGAMEETKRVVAEANEAFGRRTDDISKIEAEFAKLKSLNSALLEENAQLKAEKFNVGGGDPEGKKAPSTRERDSMLKMIIGMAVRGYGFDLGEPRSTKPKEIADDLQTLGIGLDEDTVRKYLKLARELIPGNKAEQNG